MKIRIMIWRRPERGFCEPYFRQIYRRMDLPEGNYTMTAGGEELYFSANNDAQNIGIYEQFTDEKNIGCKAVL